MLTAITKLFKKNYFVYSIIIGFIIMLLTFKSCTNKIQQYFVEKERQQTANEILQSKTDATNAEAKAKLAENENLNTQQKVKIVDNSKNKKQKLLADKKLLESYTKDLSTIKVKGGGSIRRIE